MSRLVLLVIHTLVSFVCSGFASDLVLTGATVYPSPSEAPIPNATIVIHDGSIVEIGPSASTKGPRFARAVTTIDCKGLFITAGFWNSHVHFTEDAWKNAAAAAANQLEKHMQQMLTRWGFTTVFDTASFLANTKALRVRVNKGEVPGPRIFTVGEPLYPENGIPVYVGPEWHIPQATSPQVARQMAKQRLADGADAIKVFAGAIVKGGVVLPMNPAIIRAAVDVAHAAGKPVFAHPSNHAGTDNALAGGVDVLAHTIPIEARFTADELHRMKTNHVALIPTISLFADEARKFGGTKDDEIVVTDRSIAQLKSYFDIGGTVLFGTDVGYTQLYDTTSEFQSMAKSGMSWRDILASLTTTPATFFKVANTGRIAKGMDGDIVVLRGDPAAEVANFSQVAFTIRNGRIIYRSH